MNEQFNISVLAEVPDLQDEQRAAMQALATEYLGRLGVVHNELDQRTPLEQLSAYQSAAAEHAEPVKDIFKTRLMHIAAGFSDPGHDTVLASIEQEEQEKQARSAQSRV